MADFRARGGIEVTDEMIDRWDDDADKGIYHGKAGKLIVRKPLGRPPLHEEAMVPVTFRLPGKEADALHAAAERRGVSFADLIREACRRELEDQVV